MQLSKDFTAYHTIVRKEVTRFLRIWTQTLIPPVITQSLYFLIFGKFIGSQIPDIQGVSYMSFIVPGLVMMSIINNAYANVSGSFFSSKFQRSVEELLVSPTPNWVMIAGYVTGGMLRGIIVGILVFVVSVFFTKPMISHFFVIAVFMVLTSLLFALGGFLNGILARGFDDIGIFPMFVLTPLTYLGGVFYSLNSLPEVWRDISYFNPILYLVNGFRYGFYGFADVSLLASLSILVFFVIVLIVVNLEILKRGIGLKN